MISEVLRRVPLFAGLSEEHLQYVLQGNEIRLRSGECVKRAGDLPDGFHIAIEGQIKWASRVGEHDDAPLRSQAGCSWRSPSTAQVFQKRCNRMFSNPFSQPRT
jgi:hypothetical protein